MSLPSPTTKRSSDRARARTWRVFPQIARHVRPGSISDGPANRSLEVGDDMTDPVDVLWRAEAACSASMAAKIACTAISPGAAGVDT